MGIFRRNINKVSVSNHKNKKHEEETPALDSSTTTGPTERPKIAMVILEFPPQLSAEATSSSSSSSALNPTLVFRHENDSVISDCSNCSCRISNHGRRRPDCCVACCEMREDEKKRRALRKATEHAGNIPLIQKDITDHNVTEFFSPNRQDHVLPPSIALLTKIMIVPPGAYHHHKRTHTDTSPPSSIKATTSLREKLTKSKSATGPWLVSKPTDARSLAITADLSLDHELS